MWGSSGFRNRRDIVPITLRRLFSLFSLAVFNTYNLRKQAETGSRKNLKLVSLCGGQVASETVEISFLSRSVACFRCFRWLYLIHIIYENKRKPEVEKI